MRGAALLAVFVGGLIAGFLLLPLSVGLAIAASAVLAMWGSGKLRKYPLKVGMANRIFTLSAYILFFSLGIMDVGLQPKSDFHPSEEKIYNVKGIVESRRTLTSCEIYSLNLISIGGKKERGELTLLTSADAVFEPGEIIVFTSKISENPSTAFEKCQFTARCFDSDKIEIIGKSRLPKFYFGQLREKIEDGIGRVNLSEETKYLLKALIVADRSGIDRRRIDLLRNGGAIHVLAVSGMHIGIIASLLIVITTPLVMVGGRKSRYLIIIAGVWLFVMLTGAAYSAIRAALMLTIASVGLIKERKRDAFSAVCFATLMILVVDPYAIADVGLQLSFVSVAALTLLATPLNPIDHRKHPLTFRLFTMVLTTLIATAATWMLCGYHFGSAPVRFLPANLIILPVLPIYMLSAILYLILCSLGIDVRPLGLAIDCGPEYLFQLLDKISSPSLAIEVGIIALSLWLLAMLLMGITFRLDANPVIITFRTKAIRHKDIMITISLTLALVSLIMLPSHL